jgi:glutathione S-transferase
VFYHFSAKSLVLQGGDDVKAVFSFRSSARKASIATSSRNKSRGEKVEFVELVAVLAVLQFLCFGALTGGARRASGIKAPAITGHPTFERMYRVQMNTLEILVAFIPVLFLAAQYWPPVLVAGLGAIYLVGRILYWRAYVTDPGSRAIGFILSLVPTLILTVLALVGILLSIVGVF